MASVYTVYDNQSIVVLSVNPVGLGGWVWGSSLKHRNSGSSAYQITRNTHNNPYICVYVAWIQNVNFINRVLGLEV